MHPFPYRRSLLLVLSLLAIASLPVRAADHGDAPIASLDRGGDLADGYLFLDPTDNTKLVAIMTIGGFIVPSEAVNFGNFDPNVNYVFNFENTGDARPDRSIVVNFSERTSTATPQTATIRFSSKNKDRYTAPATNASLAAAAPTPVVTTLPNGVDFFAGGADDPFFFDIPGFNRFVASVLANAPDVSHLNRGRDSFAGYNVLAIALRIPVSLIGPSSSHEIGMNVVTEGDGRDGKKEKDSHEGKRDGAHRTIDRMGVPAVNVALIPFARKNEYNTASTEDDAKGRFAGDIVGTLKALGTNDTNIGILASVAVARGDFLRLDVTKPNAGPGGGNTAGNGFPNGRRLGDDVIDTLLFFIANQNALGDNVNGNDVAFRDQFPFLGASQQPRAAGVIDDNTRN